ncbi:MAG: alpha-amylase, partial [Spirochaetaceae bacterium]|nr:alpha-amylase [Spirochaetaceae bacterium]
PDSIASQIVNINQDEFLNEWGEMSYTNPFGNNGKNLKKYSDAVIYEMHIRDWSRAFVPDSTGKFLDIAENLENNGIFAQHLKDLGVTHVQIMPVFDYAQTNDDAGYNWGYNPYHYNVPEGRYVRNMQDGIDSVQQMRRMIKAFHQAGIAVIMDVVYNHTSGTGKYSLYDMTSKEYFYRVDKKGVYSNGSGCGNEIATNHSFVKKYVIESLKHWMRDYHINGFRFDLMGLHEKSFMKSVYNELYKIDKNVMIYGEPWAGGLSPVKNPSTEAISCAGKNKTGVGAFDDEFRDAIKGGEFGGFSTGQVQGNFRDFQICRGLCGITSRNPNAKEKPELTIHYAECHDNYTLADKLAISLVHGHCQTDWKEYDEFSEAQKESLRKQNKLAAAFVILAQGTPFINGGQEFCRTKRGDENSYISCDKVNQIDLSLKDKFRDVYDTYKGLIYLRKMNPTIFGANPFAKAETLAHGVTKYTTENFCVYFNATKWVYIVETYPYQFIVEVSSGIPSESTIQGKHAVPPMSFVILRRG